MRNYDCVITTIKEKNLWILTDFPEYFHYMAVDGAGGGELHRETTQLDRKIKITSVWNHP